MGNSKTSFSNNQVYPEFLRPHQQRLMGISQAIQKNELDIAIRTTQELFLFLKIEDFEQYIDFLMIEVICNHCQCPDIAFTLVSYFPSDLVELGQTMVVSHFLEKRELKMLSNEVLLFQLQWILHFRDCDRAVEITEVLLERITSNENIDLEGRIVKSAGPPCSEDIELALDFLSRLLESLAGRIRLWIVANKLHILSIKEAKMFEEDILKLKKYSNQLFQDCLKDLIIIENDDVFFYVIELVEDSVRFDNKRIVFMAESEQGLLTLGESLMDVIWNYGTAKMKLWAKNQMTN